MPREEYIDRETTPVRASELDIENNSKFILSNIGSIKRVKGNKIISKGIRAN